ncbi:hypothetical protein [Varunaivibrio sulfuroxidans]|uniref:Secreted protein n=1 Tax=Varunaivibrio sulfuroxidans TaxID=1773489 RepID=A0A4R3JED4_9PROT|nr:hypothetical protein [Varunaivibrio sulfuroxidans]TCS63456.1 secreted protein [Varunaivibrio sulfuroxidans]WES30398.1 formate dehydrogenase [Varunaivibrio sulfuroxidans]
MSDSQKNVAPELRARRAFLKGALLSTGGVAALAVGGAGSASAAVQAARVETPRDAGYRETDHVRAYYAAARF